MEADYKTNIWFMSVRMIPLSSQGKIQKTWMKPRSRLLVRGGVSTLPKEKKGRQGFQILLPLHKLLPPQPKPQNNNR